MNVEVGKSGMWIDMPDEFFAKTRCKTMHVDIRFFYEALASLLEDDELYEQAAMVRDVVACYPSRGDPIRLVDDDGTTIDEYGNWGRLSEEARANRGNRYATIAILDQIRNTLEMMNDTAEHAELIKEAKRNLTEMFFE